MARDKKFSEGLKKFVLLRAVGEGFVSEEIPVSSIAEAISDLRSPVASLKS
jgi:3-dehydroquinate synthetase